MSLKLSGWDDTIVALATPPGIGALGIIRLSGANALQIIAGMFLGKDLALQPSHTLHVGYLKHRNKLIDEVVVSLFKSPRSYTGEHVVEISCHGSPFIHQQVINACIENGARLAKPGEFTQRAFLAGKLDLTQAEAVADLILSNTAASHKAALHNIRGGFSESLKGLREQLLTFSALIELELDFSGEDVEFADRTALNRLVQDALEQTGKLVQSFNAGNVIKNGVSVAIIGKPNAGKSTLLNMLLNEERAIVSDIPGTTRDTVEEVLNIDGILFRLIDTACMRVDSNDVIENLGIEKSLQKMRGADLVIYLFDVNELKEEELQHIAAGLQQQGIKYLLAGNKIDSANRGTAPEQFSNMSGLILISAKDNLHLEVLKERMVDSVLEGEVQAEATLITNARHYHALRKIVASLHDVTDGLKQHIPGDLLALDIRLCLQYLGEITGEITNEDQLDYIFSKFCIGK